MSLDRTRLDTDSPPASKRPPTRGSAMNRLSLFITALLALLPILLGAYFIKRYAVNVVFWDEWDVVPLLDKWYAGTWTFAHWWAQHNEHRIVFPRLLLITLWHWTHLNTRAGAWATWVMLCLLAAVLYVLTSPVRAGRTSALLWFAPISWLIFSWRQWENLLWGIQIVATLMVLCVVSAILLLERSEWLDGSYWLAMGCAVVGSLSLANGLLIWPVGLVQLIGRHPGSSGRCTNRLWAQIGVWSLAGGVVYTLYFWGYHKPGHHPSLLFFLQHPLAAMQYFLAYWGSPLVGGEAAWVAGAILAAIEGWTIAVLLRKQKLSRTALPYFSLVLFAVLSGVTLVVARAGFGVAQATASRYVIYSSLGLIGAIALVQLIESNAQRRTFRGVLLGFVLVSALVSYLHDGNRARLQWAERGEAAFFLRSSSCQSDEKLRLLYPDANVVRARVSFLEQHHLNVFYRQPPIACLRGNAMKAVGDGVDTVTFTAHQGTDYVVDLINHHPGGVATDLTMDSRHEPVITLAGWAVDRAVGGPVSGVSIHVDGQQDFPATYGQERLDVAVAFNQPAYWHSGFAAALPVVQLGEGQHVLRLKMLSVDRRQYYWSER